MQKKGFGTAPVFFTAIATILGAILFLRFDFAVGMLGFPGTLLIVLVGHMVTIPTALAISELATNQRVEGGGEYFIISRSFGLNIGATIGIALYLSQAISVAFYIIAFTEAFNPIFAWLQENFIPVPKQVLGVLTLGLLALLILKKGSSMGMSVLYIVVLILGLSLVLFFMGKTGYASTADINVFAFRKEDIGKSFFVVFAIIFPAFTGMTAGVGLSGDLKNPSKSIPLGTTLATVLGMIIYVFIAYKFTVSASPDQLASGSMVMKEIAIMGPLVIPLGLAASTLSSAIGSIMVAPRTIQALGIDQSLPFKKLNLFAAKGKGKASEPYNATVLTIVIAFFFVIQGEVDFVASIISMFFMVTYGSICLISFLYHFGADPSYRPVFRSKWYVSLLGFIMCAWLMFKMNTSYALLAVVIMVLLYFYVSSVHKDRAGMQSIFQGAAFQLNRKLQVFIQKATKSNTTAKWRPSVVCISEDSLERDKALRLLGWIANRYGFGTYIHLIEDYFSASANQKATDILDRLLELSDEKSNVYLDTLISPSYTSAIAQIVQLPGISGMPNNILLLEFNKEQPEKIKQIAENVSLAKAAMLDICVLASCKRRIQYSKGIHVWIKSTDIENSNLMILLSYIMLGHPDWRKGKIKIFEIAEKDMIENTRQKLLHIIQEGRLPISPANIEIVEKKADVNYKTQINEGSAEAGLVVVGFLEEQLKHDMDVFQGYDQVGDVLFVYCGKQKPIE